MTVADAVLRAVMDEAVEQCAQHVAAGGLPFVGVVVDRAGVMSDFGVNRVQETGDATAHAEIVAMRDAMARHGRRDLLGAVLVATGEPCGLCYRFALDHGIETIYVAVDQDAAAAWGFDYRGSYCSLGITDELRSDHYRALPSRRGEEPFVRYQHQQTERTHA